MNVLEMPKGGEQNCFSLSHFITQLLEELVILCCLFISDIHFGFSVDGEVLPCFACIIQSTEIVLKIP